MRESEYKKILLNYFKKNISKGYTVDTLKWALIKQGNSRTAVDWALETAQKEMAEKAPLLTEKPKIDYEAFNENNQPAPIKKSWWRRLFGSK